MKHRFLLTWLLFSGLLCASATTPVIHMEQEDSRPQVAETGRLDAVSMPGVRNNSGVPRGSTAGRLAVNGYEFNWTPSQQSGKATGGADLLSAALSDDETVLLLTERIGGKDKPNSTRLILINIRSGKIIRSTLLKERRIAEARFIPGTDQLLAIQHAQKEFEMPEALVRIDLKTGRVIARSKPAGGELLSFCTDGSKAWYTVKDQEYIYELDLAAMDQEAQAIRSRITGSRLIITPDMQTVIAFGKEKIEKFKVSAEQKLALIQTIDILPGFAPTQALAADDSGFQLFLVEPDKKAVLYKGSSPTEADMKPASFHTIYRKDNTLFYGILKHNAIGKIALPGISISGRPVVPGKLKPVSRNVTWKMFALSTSPCKILLIDTRSNISMLEVTKRRWKKSNILLVDKTGM